MRGLGVILLAGGLSKRMKSSLPKVLHSLGGKPLLSYPLKTARGLNPQRIAIVVGRGADAMRRIYNDDEVVWVFQEKQLGTGHAVHCTQKIFRDFSGDLLILPSDVPLISQKTLQELLRHHREENATLTLLTVFLDHPVGYGRVLRNDKGEVVDVVEERDATQTQRKIKEVNGGIYAVSPRFLYPALAELSNRCHHGEYYLPDIVEVALRSREPIRAVRAEDAREVLGINTREELMMLEKILQEKINRKWMDAGVTLKDPETTYIEENVVIGRDTVIGPNMQLLGCTVIGERCLIDGNAYLKDVHLGNEVHLKSFVVLTDCRIEDGAVIDQTFGQRLRVPPKTVATTRHNRRRWDVFISHAAEDGVFAREIAGKLQSEGFKVWYDEFVLTAGDRLMEKIDEGLAHSRYGVVLLSHAFFRKSWTKKELDGLAALEVGRTKRKVILPVWHDFTAEEVRRYSPSLAGRVGIPTKEGIEFVVGELIRAIRLRRK